MTKNKIYKKILHFILYMRLLLIIPLLIIIIGIASLNISFFLNNSLQNYSLTTAFTNKVPNPTEYSIQNDTTPIPQEILAYVAEFQNQATIGQYNQTKILLGASKEIGGQPICIGENMTFYNGMYGNYTFNAANDSNFKQIINYLTNDQLDYIYVGSAILNNSRPVISSYRVGNETLMLLKSQPKNIDTNGSSIFFKENPPDLLKHQPDFAGYRITFIQLDIQSLSIYYENYQGKIETSLTLIAVWEIWGYPIISIISPNSNNIAIASENIPLTYSIYPSTAKVWYSLDNETNITLTENTTLRLHNYGLHNITIWANDTDMNLINFTIFFNTSQQLSALPVLEVTITIVFLALIRKIQKNKS